MSTKKRLVTLFSIPCMVGFFLLTACTSKVTRPPSTPFSQLTQICQNLKQEISISSVDTMSSQFANNITQDAQLYKDYKRYDCDTVLQQQKKK